MQPLGQEISKLLIPEHWRETSLHAYALFLSICYWPVSDMGQGDRQTFRLTQTVALRFCPPAVIIHVRTSYYARLTWNPFVCLCAWEQLLGRLMSQLQQGSCYG